MKSIIYLFTSSLLIILASSCNKNNESFYSATETKLSIEIPISVINSADSKSELLQQNKDIPFSGTIDYRLYDIINPLSGIRNIRSITAVDGSVFAISQIVDGSEINSLNFNWGYKSLNDADYFMMEPIDLLSVNHQFADGGFELSFDGIANVLLDEIKDSNIMLRFEITGNSNNDVNGTANLEVPVIIESEVISPRFTLF